jgi:D-alanine-D-alanine ligase-like ATP-grasp enzyme
VNPNPYLLPSAEFCMAARQGGRSFPQLIDRIVEVAMARYTNGNS